MAATWHPGELAVQRRAGVEGAMDPGFITDRLIPGSPQFLAEMPWLLLGAADADGRVWASVLYGAPGFVRAIAASTVHVAARPVAGDPLAPVLSLPAQVGGLAIRPATRHRMRLNGRSLPDGDGALVLELEQVYGNCPKYIATREPSLATAGPARAPATSRRATALDAEQRARIAAADTFFVASRSPKDGVDVSHRGGMPGFVRVSLDGTRLAWPDYAGNDMFNTLGNLALDPAAGVTFVGFEDGTTLQVSGRARTVWDPELVAGFPGARRLVELDVEAVVQLDAVSPLTWRLERLSRSPPAR